MGKHLHPISSALSGKTLHQYRVHIGLYTLSSMRSLRMGCRIAKGVSKRCVSRLLLTVHLPISITMLHDMITALPLLHPNHCKVYMFSALLAVGFHDLFCLKELTYSQHSITIDNLHVSASRIVVVLLTSKANSMHIAQ